MKQVAQLLLMCDGRDIGLSVNAGETASPPDDQQRRDTPRIFLYDAYPGGIGFSAPLLGMQPELLSQTRALIAGCDCDNGCPMCVGPIGETGPLAKTVALRMLQHLAGGVARGRFSDGSKPSLSERRKRKSRSRWRRSIDFATSSGITGRRFRSSDATFDRLEGDGFSRRLTRGGGLKPPPSKRLQRRSRDAAISSAAPSSNTPTAR